jgi:nucleoid-associated protein YgaU
MRAMHCLIAALLFVTACAGERGSAVNEDEFFLDPAAAPDSGAAGASTDTTVPPAPPAWQPPPEVYTPPPAAPASAGTGAYKVQKGDTLYSIARKELGNASRWKELASLNSLQKPYVIKVGQELKLP